jgi:hypothetical protein
MEENPKLEASFRRKRRKEQLNRKRKRIESASIEGTGKKESAFARYRRYMMLKQKRQRKCCTDEFKTKEAASARSKRKEKIRERKNPKCERRERVVRKQEKSSANSSRSINSTNVDNEIWDFGKPTCRCQHCNALLWYEERLGPNKQTKKPSFGICCKNGKISLPAYKTPPEYLQRLLNRDDKQSKNFRENIRSYNSMFSFTSTGGVVDKEINKGHGPYVFRMHGQNYHHIGSLLPEEGNKPRWAGLGSVIHI